MIKIGKGCIVYSPHIHRNEFKRLIVNNKTAKRNDKNHGKMYDVCGKMDGDGAG